MSPDPNWWNAAPGELYGDPDDERDDDEDYVECPKCGGSGLSIEGWDCWYCDGDGYIEV